VPGTFQISGVISGLDTGQIIEKLMSVEQRPLRALESQQQRIKDRKAALLDLAAKLSALRSKTLNLLLSGTSQARKTTSTDPNVAVANANPTTALQQVQLNVTQLATKTQVSSGTPIGQPINSGVPLASAGFATKPTSGTFSINGVSISINASTQSLTNVITAINGANAGVTASLTGGNQLKLESNSPISLGAGGDTSNFLQATKLAASVSVNNGGTWTNTSTSGLGTAQPALTLQNARLATAPDASGSFSINGVSFAWNAATDTINGLISKINTSAAKVTASYDATTDRFTLVAKDTGPAVISLSDDTGNLLSALGVAGATQQYGKTAQYTINGGATQSSTSNVITDAISGMTFTLKGTGPTTIDVAQDVEKPVSAIKEWVAAYNEALTLVRDLTKIDPVTKEAGIFSTSTMVKSIERQLRQVLSARDLSLSSSYTELARIGLTSGRIGSAPGTTNEMVLDEAKLTQALTDDPEAVTALLTSPNGPIASLNTKLLDLSLYSGSLSTAQASADRQLNEIGARMRDLQSRLDARQLALEKKFAALESAMAKLQAQAAQLSGQFGALSGVSPRQ
jgi:flagellar hook-associated protein 2